MKKLNFAVVAILFALPGCGKKETPPAAPPPAAPAAAPAAGAPADAAAAAPADAAKKGPPCLKDSEKKFEDGKVTECELTENYKVGDVSCVAKQKIQLRADGTLKSCDLAEPVEIQGFPCASGSLTFDESGKVYFCGATSKELKVGEVVIPAGSLINPFGKSVVQYAELKDGATTKYKTLTCKQVFFDEAGKLTKCYTAADTKWKGKKVKASTMVELGPKD